MKKHNNEAKQEVKQVVKTGEPTNPISEKDRATGAAEQLVALTAYIEPMLSQPLTVKQSREVLRVRLGGAQLIPLFVQLIATRPQLVPNGLTAAEMQTSLDTVGALKAFSSALTGLQKQVEDTVRVREAQLWKDALDVYAIASRSRGDAEVKSAVDQMRAAMANGPRFARAVRTPLPKAKRIVIPPAKPTITFAPDATGAGTSSPSQPVSTGGGGAGGNGGGSSNSNGGSGDSAPTSGTSAGLNGSGSPSSANGASPVGGGA